MNLHTLPRPAALLGLLGAGALSTSTALANPWQAGPGPYGPQHGWQHGWQHGQQHLGWVQAQRHWADQSHRQHMLRLNQLEQCLNRARHRRDHEQCLRRDEQARERQWQRDQQEWHALLRWQGTQARMPWR